MARTYPSTPTRRRQVERANSARLAQELADQLLGVLIATSRRGSFDTPTGKRLELIKQVTLALTSRIAKRIYNIKGKKQAAAFRAALVQTVNDNSKGIRQEETEL